MRHGKAIRAAGIIPFCWVFISWGGEVRLTTLVSFDGANGREPWCGLVQADDGNFYGTTSLGGAYGCGTVFKMSPDGQLTTLHSFKLDSNGAVPQAGLTLGRDGCLYGTTRDAPPYFGTIFRITTNGVVTTLVRFNLNNGAAPWNGALFQGSDGNFYGTTANGGKTNTMPMGYGTAFRVTPDGLLTTLHLFDYPSGDTPYGGLIEGFDGHFYGTTAHGGRLGGGTVFRLTRDGKHTELVSFHYRGTNGLIPFSAVIQGRDGNFYGTTTQGGASYGHTNSVNQQGFGTIFKMTPDGQLTTLFSFYGTNGAYPYASLVEGPDGAFYGVTMSGGAFTNQLFPNVGGDPGYGTVFRITTNGAFTSLISFARTNGARPLGNLTLGKDGKFYGTTLFGSAHDLGTVFRLSLPSAPTITCPDPTIIECGSLVEISVQVGEPDGDALTVVWSLNGQPIQTNIVQSADPPTQVGILLADLPLGTNVIAVSVTDTDANSASCSTEIIVLDTNPPIMLSVAADPDVLWPPNHQMVTVNLRAVVLDKCGAATWRIIGVRSNEPGSGHGSGRVSPDWEIIDEHTLRLRAERSGLGFSRVYEIEVQACDEAGNLSEPQIVTVRVPKSRVQVQ